MLELIGTMCLSLGITGSIVLVYCLIKSKIEENKKEKINTLPKIKSIDEDNIKIKIIIKEDEFSTVFNYNTKERKLTHKDKEVTGASFGIMPIIDAEGTIYFYTQDEGKLYRIKDGKAKDISSIESSFEDEFDDWDD